MILKFNLNGKTAFFKNPEVNSNVFFTYNHIHKISVMGLIGATIGLNGYNQSEKGILPEFYEKLKDIKVAICPSKKFFSKQIVTTTNTTGFASKEGGALIVKEQILFNVSWDIYIKIDSPELVKFKDMILNNESVYLQYLGKNEHLANIKDVNIFDEDIIEKEGLVNINSLFPVDQVTIEEANYVYKELLPVKLNKITSIYELEKFGYTDGKINCRYNSINNKNIIFI